MDESKKLKRAKKKDKKNKKTDSKNKSTANKQLFVRPLPVLNESIQFDSQEVPTKKSEENDNSEDDEADKITDPSETQMLDSLTGIPYTEDELLFAVPVVAPYSALTNYK